MSEPLIVECPCCKTKLDIDPVTGEIVRHWKAGEKNIDPKARFQGALEKIKHDKDARKTLFESTAGKIEEQKKKAKDAFLENLKKAKEEGPVKPPSPFDLE